jgi:hypothetical protein
MKRCELACGMRTLALALLACTCAASARAQVGSPADPPLLNPNLAKPEELAAV